VRAGGLIVPRRPSSAGTAVGSDPGL